MSYDYTHIGLSRRETLGGLDAIGIGSAGTGLGTSTYFSDFEIFENNTLSAGELDFFVPVGTSEDQSDCAQYSMPPGTFIDGNVVCGEEPVPKVNADPIVGSDFFSSANAIGLSE